MTALRSLGVRWSVMMLLIGAFADIASAQREAPRPGVRGTVKAVAAGTITVTVEAGRGPARTLAEPTGNDRTFAVPAGAEVAFGNFAFGRAAVLEEIKLTDIPAGTVVSLSLSADEKSAESVVAEEPQVRGAIQKIDLAAKTITVDNAFQRRDPSQPAESQTYALSDTAEIAVDDGRGRRFSIREAKLAELAQGAQVALSLSLDRKTVRAVHAEGAQLFGLVKLYDAASRTLTVTVRPGRGDQAAEERTVAVAEDATILLDDGRGRRLSVKAGKPTDVAPGLQVQGRLSVDGARVTMLRVEGPTLFGLFKSADAANSTITLAFPRSRAEPPEEKTLKVSKDAKITSDGTETTLGALKAVENGPFVQVRMSLDQTTAQAVTARGPDRR